MEVKTIVDGVRKIEEGKPIIKEFKFEVDKSLASENGEIVFIASTKKEDRLNDQVFPDGFKIKTNLKLLYGHDSKTLNGLIGIIKKVWNEGDKLYAKAIFNTSEYGQLARKLVQEGFLDEFSISFMPLKYNWNENGGMDFIEWELTEISLVPTPAHRDTGVISIKSLESKEEKPIEIDTYKEQRIKELTVIRNLLRDKPEEFKELVRAKLSGNDNL